MKTLKEMQAEVYEVNVDNGWYDSARSFGDGMALLHSEVSEAFEAYRDRGVEDWVALHYGAGQSFTREALEVLARFGVGSAEEVWLYSSNDIRPSIDPPLSPDEKMALAVDGVGKPEGVGSEFADILIRLLDECQRQGIDLTWEYERKIAFNKTRGHRHGGKRV